MISTHALQKSVIHHIAAANSMYTLSLSSVYLRSCLMFGEITSRNVYCNMYGVYLFHILFT